MPCARPNDSAASEDRRGALGPRWGGALDAFGGETHMQVKQLQIRGNSLNTGVFDDLRALDPQLVMVFAAPGLLAQGDLRERLTEAFPRASRVGCSTCGEISNDGVRDETAVVTAVHFDAPALRAVSTGIGAMDDSFDAGVRLGTDLVGDGLHAVLVFGQGVEINGSALIEGLVRTLGPGVTVSGGLAGDNGAFVKTFVLHDDVVSDRRVTAVGFYSPRTEVHHGSFGGWQPFGPARLVTRCRQNVLYELDGEPALGVYKRYLGAYAEGLPSSGLLFPFAMLDGDSDERGLIRTILGVSEAEGSLVLAGDVHEGGYLRLMHASTDSLVEGAQAAAAAARRAAQDDQGVTLLVSCVGRKLVMGARVDEEIEAVGEVFGGHSTLTGFYSHGEISPLLKSTDCRLHNQTMTVTHIAEH